MPNNIFSVPIFIVLRETIEAAIIVSVLLGLVESLVARSTSTPEGVEEEDEETRAARKKFLVRKLRIQIWAGTAAGLICALAIGAAFIAVFFTTLSDIWSKSEEIWEGTFSLLAAIIIFIMGLTMLRIDRSKVKWQQKLEGAFNEKVADTETDLARKEGKASKWALFLLPAITVLREGLEAVVFVGGVSLGQSARAIPLAAIVGLICGLFIGWCIYKSSSKLNLTLFLIISTDILFLLGAGLFSKSVGDFERNKFNNGVGSDVAELGSGPGSYDVRQSVWHLDYARVGHFQETLRSTPPPMVTVSSTLCKHRYRLSHRTKALLTTISASLGWSNDASYGTILSYVFFWIAVMVSVVYMKWSEGRTTVSALHINSICKGLSSVLQIFGRESAAGRRSRVRREKKAEKAASDDDLSKKEKEKTGLEGETTATVLPPYELV
ncbi:high-affinity iron transporter, partial [Phenoliferia sp. Uapishka_3]